MYLAKDYNLLFDKHPQPMWVYEIDSCRFLAINEAAIKLYGYSREEFLQMSGKDIRLPEDIPRLLNYSEKFNQRGHSRSFEDAGLWQHRTKSGNLLAVRVAWSIIDWNETKACLVCINNLSEEKLAQKQIHEWKNRYEMAVNASGQILYDWDCATNGVVYGGCYEKMLGYTDEELKGGLARWLELLHPDDRDPFQKEIERSTAAKAPFTLEYRIMRKDGTYTTCLDIGHSFLDEKGDKQRVIGFLQDITQRKHLERIALQSEKLSAVGQMAAGVAHEINNPLAVILGFSESLKKRMNPTDELYAPMNSIVREALRCKTLVNNLLTFSRSSTPGIAAEAPAPLLESALSLVEIQARLRHVDVKREFESALPPVLADRNQIQQVVINLCTNAMDAMPQGGTLTIGLAKAGSEIEIRVTDTGTGIPQEIQAHILEPFFTTKEVGKGTGLGLSLAYEIVKKHQGRLEFRSELGKGTTFTVCLPLAPIPFLTVSTPFQGTFSDLPGN